MEAMRPNQDGGAEWIWSQTVKMENQPDVELVEQKSFSPQHRLSVFLNISQI